MSHIFNHDTPSPAVTTLPRELLIDHNNVLSADNWPKASSPVPEVIPSISPLRKPTIIGGVLRPPASEAGQMVETHDVTRPIPLALGATVLRSAK